MSDVVVALIGLAGTVVSIVLTARVNGKVRRVHEQVENDHARDPNKTTNLRDDLDEKHAELRRDIGGLRGDIRQVRIDLSRTDERVLELETTQEKRSWP